MAKNGTIVKKGSVSKIGKVSYKGQSQKSNSGCFLVSKSSLIEVAGGWLQESKKVLPGIARACLMASTLEDSFRYWRDYKMYNTYFDKTDYKCFLNTAELGIKT